MSLTFFISLFNAQHVSDVNISILRSLRLICCVISWVAFNYQDDSRSNKHNCVYISHLYTCYVLHLSHSRFLDHLIHIAVYVSSIFIYNNTYTVNYFIIIVF